MVEKFSPCSDNQLRIPTWEVAKGFNLRGYHTLKPPSRNSNKKRSIDSRRPKRDRSSTFHAPLTTRLGGKIHLTNCRSSPSKKQLLKTFAVNFLTRTHNRRTREHRGRESASPNSISKAETWTLQLI